MEEDDEETMKSQDLSDKEDEPVEQPEVDLTQFSTMRLKKLFSIIFSEFKPKDTNQQMLSEEEHKKYQMINSIDKNNLKAQFGIDVTDESKFKRDNFKIMGMASEDLR